MLAALGICAPAQPRDAETRYQGSAGLADSGHADDLALMSATHRRATIKLARWADGRRAACCSQGARTWAARRRRRRKNGDIASSWSAARSHGLAGEQASARAPAPISSDEFYSSARPARFLNHYYSFLSLLVSSRLVSARPRRDEETAAAAAAERRRDGRGINWSADAASSWPFDCHFSPTLRHPAGATKAARGPPSARLEARPLPGLPANCSLRLAADLRARARANRLPLINFGRREPVG